MNKPSVSIRITNYNFAKYLNEALQGVFMQKTNFAVEVIIGDDFSTDNSMEVIQNFFQNNHIPENFRVNILHRTKGDAYSDRRSKLGRLYNFSNTIDACNGKYIALLDGDDYWTDEHKLQKQFEAMEAEPDVVICFHEAREVYENKPGKQDAYTVRRLIGQGRSYYTITDLIRYEWFLPTASVMVRNNKIEEWPAFFYKSASGDICYYYILLKNGGRIKFIDSPMCVWRRNADGVTMNQDYNNFVYPNRIEMYKAIDALLDFKYKAEVEKRIEYFKNKLRSSNEKPGLVIRVLQRLKNRFK